MIGQPTGGMVIGTSETALIDGSTFRLPRTGVFTTKGVNMERAGVIPDVLVDALPEDLAEGNDPQLKKAVEVVTVEVAEWKRAKTTGIAAKPPLPAAAPPSTPATGMAPGVPK